jgi:hypothetical protein
MEEHPDKASMEPENKGFPAFVIKRISAAMIVIAVVIYGLAVGIDYLQKSELIPEQASRTDSPAESATRGELATHLPTLIPVLPATDVKPEPLQPDTPQIQPLAIETPAPEKTEPQVSEPLKPILPEILQERPKAPPAPQEKPAVDSGAKDPGTAPKERSRQPEMPAAAGFRPPGIAFVEAVIKPLDYELNQRFWGWRPNDLINLTDNVNNYQLGVLEVTRRTVVQLAERISRTGYNDSFDRDLENAMNWLMIKASSYWFPSPETKYKESISELENYKHNLINKKAYFYTRSDNLIPLLAAFEDLLGSCDTNLVKTKEADGSKVGFFKADDYFYYAKGVSSSMGTILEAISLDFAPILSNRNAAELLHKAIVSCRMASSLDPWIITNGSLDGILANHRAHMAAPISHARYYLGQLIKTLST